jgi:Uma2 family endonuclease
MTAQTLLDELESGPEKVEQMSFDQLTASELEQPELPAVAPVARAAAPVTGRHQDLCLYITVLLKSFVEALDAGLVRDAPFDVCLDDQHTYQPDVLFVSHHNYDRVHETYVEGPPDIIIEVLTVESTARDRGEKFAAYEAAGVSEYWIVDPIREMADLYHLGPDGYYDAFRPDIAGRLRSRVLRGFMLDLDLLWKRVLPTTAETVEMVQGMIAQR